MEPTSNQTLLILEELNTSLNESNYVTSGLYDTIFIYDIYIYIYIDILYVYTVSKLRVAQAFGP